MENKWEFDYGSNPQPMDRPGDTSSYSTDSDCGYTAPARPEPYSAPEPAPQEAEPVAEAQVVESPVQHSNYQNNYNGGNGGGNGFDPHSNGYYTPRAPRSSGTGKKVFKRVLSLALVAAIGFGSGIAGAKFAGVRPAAAKVVYQAASSGLSSEGTELPAGAMNKPQVAAQVSPSVVVITTEALVSSNTWFGGQYVESGAGSGVIISEDGTILTCAHVVNGATSIKVTLPDDPDKEYDATVIGSDTRSDVATIQIEADGLTPAIIGNSDALMVGEDVMAVGNPMGTLGGSVSTGVVSALNREIKVKNSAMNVIQMDASISPGNSGGGLFNARGELVGIVNAKSAGNYSEGIGFAIPINTAMEIAGDLIETGHVTGRPALGVTVVTISDSQTAAYYNASSYGVLIAEITEGGGADKAGLEVGDMIIALDGQMVSDNNTLVNLIAKYKVGDEVELQINRDRQLMTFTVTLGESAG